MSHPGPVSSSAQASYDEIQGMVEVVVGGIAAYCALALPFAVVVGRSFARRDIDVRPLTEPYPAGIETEQAAPIAL